MGLIRSDINLVALSTKSDAWNATNQWCWIAEKSVLVNLQSYLKESKLSHLVFTIFGMILLPSFFSMTFTWQMVPSPAPTIKSPLISRIIERTPKLKSSFSGPIQLSKQDFMLTPRISPDEVPQKNTESSLDIYKYYP